MSKVEKFEIGKCYIQEKRNFKEVLKIESEYNNEQYGTSIKKWIYTMECAVETVIYHNPQEFREVHEDVFSDLKRSLIKKLL